MEKDHTELFNFENSKAVDFEGPARRPQNSAQSQPVLESK